MSESHDDGVEQALSVTAHRPWPMPDRPWIMFQSWQRLLFAHWPIDAAKLRSHVPPPLVIDLFEGQAWITIAPFEIKGLRARGLPALPGTSDFPEFNVRTYVRYGDKPGVLFFSLDAGNLLAVGAARAAFALPYYHARMSVEQHDDWVRYVSERDERARFEGRYRPIGDEYVAAPGSLDEFLVERYALYAAPRPNQLRRTDIQHAPWRLRPAEADIAVNTMVQAAGLELPDRAPLLHYSERQDVVVWAPTTSDR